VQKLSDLGHEALLDDREARPGEKFADADLIGAPVRITVARRRSRRRVDLRTLASGEDRGWLRRGRGRRSELLA